jgi:hypothetical protein
VYGSGFSELDSNAVSETMLAASMQTAADTADTALLQDTQANGVVQPGQAQAVACKPPRDLQKPPPWGVGVTESEARPTANGSGPPPALRKKPARMSLQGRPPSTSSTDCTGTSEWTEGQKVQTLQREAA